MPCLAHLTITAGADAHHIKLLTGVSLPLLNSLTVENISMQHAHLLQPLTQLQALSLQCVNIAGVTALTTLTSLTRLKIGRLTFWDSAKERMRNSRMLGSTLVPLTNLQDLAIEYLSPGPLMEAMSQLTMLTKLTVGQQQHASMPDPDLGQCLPLLPRNITEVHLL
jgi:hypothetical protein